jgi:hypothetical protein
MYARNPVWEALERRVYGDRLRVAPAGTGISL